MPQHSLWKREGSNLATSGLRWVTAAALIVYALTPRADAQDNLITGEKINGYTGVPFDTRNYAYDYLVDSSLAQDDQANKRFKTVQAAYDAAPAGTSEKPTVIGIKPDVYFVRGTQRTAGIAITKDYITLLGLTDDRRKVVLADDRGHLVGASDNGYMMTVNANGFTAMNLTLLNYTNADYAYPGDSTKDLKMRIPYDTQAVAISTRGDKQVFSHVAILGLHDTMFLTTTRSYFTNVYLEGNEDFMGGGAGTMNVWENSEVYFPTGSGILLSQGVVFINTVFKASHGFSFYKPFNSPAVLINCVVPVNTPQSPVSWLLQKAPPEQSFYSLTYHTKDAKGNPAVIYDSNVGPPTFHLSRELTDREAAAFNPWNLLRASPTGVVDDWDPAGVKEKYASLGNAVFRMASGENAPAATPAATLTAAPSGTPPIAPAARGTAGQRPNSEAASTMTVRTGGPAAKLSAVVFPARAQSDPIVWSTTAKEITLGRTVGTSVLVTAHNNTGHTEHAIVKATASNGFYITIPLDVEPAQMPSPKFNKAPVVEVVAEGRAKVSYGLTGTGEDVSRITWYLCDDAGCRTRRTVAVSRGDVPLKEFELGIGAVGKYVEAEVQAKLDRSYVGPTGSSITSGPVVAGNITSTTVSPNFRNFVDASNDTYVSGMWTVLGTWQSVTNDNLPYWKSPAGDDLVNGYGIRVGSQGASLLYQNDVPTGDMQVKVVITPEKMVSAGFGYQGFGSPGSSDDSASVQHADIYIKYDPRTKTGYSLRFWHPIESPPSCMFQLFQINNGKGSPISPQQELTGVFKPNTTFILSIVGSTFTAIAANSMDSDTLSLRGTITPNEFGGTGAYWSGTVSAGNSNVISKFEITYPHEQAAPQ